MLRRPLAIVPAGGWWTGFFAIVAFAVYMTGRAYLVGLPAIFGLRYFDKFAHFFTAGLLAFFLDGALRRRMLVVSGRSLPVAAAMVLVPAGVEEFLQRYATHRTSSMWDFAADVAGVMVLIPLSRRVAQ